MPTLHNNTKIKKKSRTKARKELVDFIIEKIKEISLVSNLSSTPLTYRDVLIIATRLQNEDCLNQSLFFSISQLLELNGTDLVE